MLQRGPTSGARGLPGHSAAEPGKKNIQGTCQCLGVPRWGLLSFPDGRGTNLNPSSMDKLANSLHFLPQVTSTFRGKEVSLLLMPSPH